MKQHFLASAFMGLLGLLFWFVVQHPHVFFMIVIGLSLAATLFLLYLICLRVALEIFKK